MFVQTFLSFFSFQENSNNLLENIKHFNFVFFDHEIKLASKNMIFCFHFLNNTKEQSLQYCAYKFITSPNDCRQVRGVQEKYWKRLDHRRYNENDEIKKSFKKISKTILI